MSDDPYQADHSSEPEDRDWSTAFTTAYKAEFGFLLDADIVIDDAKVKGTGKAWSDIGQSVFEEVKTLEIRKLEGAKAKDDGGKVSSFQDVYVSAPGDAKGSRQKIPVIELEDLTAGDAVEGPALVIDATQTIFINA